MNTQETAKAPIITSMQVVPVAGHDGMLLNLSGAHGPFFTRNIVILGLGAAGRLRPAQAPVVRAGSDAARARLQRALPRPRHR